MASGQKRGRDEQQQNGSAAAAPASKQAKLGEEALPAPEGGVNYVEIDGKTCTHAVAWPEEGPAGSPLPPPARPVPAAKEFPFVLDPFQRTAINCLESGKRCCCVLALCCA